MQEQPTRPATDDGETERAHADTGIPPNLEKGRKLCCTGPSIMDEPLEDCRVSERRASHKMGDTWFHAYEVSQVVKSIGTESGYLLPG